MRKYLLIIDGKKEFPISLLPNIPISSSPLLSSPYCYGNHDHPSTSRIVVSLPLLAVSNLIVYLIKVIVHQGHSTSNGMFIRTVIFMINNFIYIVNLITFIVTN